MMMSLIIVKVVKATVSLMMLMELVRKMVPLLMVTETVMMFTTGVCGNGQ